MGDLLGTGLAWLENQRHRHLTRTVTYHRGGLSVSLAATIGRTEFEQADAFGIVHRIESRDFLVRAEDLVFGEERTLPEAGDQVRESINEALFVYEVMAPGNEPPYRWSDVNRRTLRIHTKHVATATVS